MDEPQHGSRSAAGEPAPGVTDGQAQPTATDAPVPLTAALDQLAPLAAASQRPSSAQTPPLTAADNQPPTAADDQVLLRAMRGHFGDGPQPTYWLTRFVYLRAIGFIYCVAFLILHEQMLPLFGSHGLLPAQAFMDNVHEYSTFWRLPGLFWFGASDRALSWAADLGLLLSILVLCGLENAFVMAALWALYLSFVHVGQVWYGYGWETLLLEAGFLSIFLCPCTRVLPLRDPSAAALLVIYMQRWLLFRLMLGAGLIKLRGDPCWRDLTCLAYHYETQPNPHPLSWLLHQAPLWFHRAGTAFNHFVELIVPAFLLGRRSSRQLAGLFVIAFQTMLILSGNLSFLNWLTIAVALVCFDDAFWGRLLPRHIVQRAQRLEAARSPNRARDWVAIGLAVLVLVLSISPVMNMLSPHQRMNTSFEPLHLVNSYGAFGSVGKQRDEVILEGTPDARPGPGAHWRAYEFKCKPGDVKRRPCWITPYHYRLDWQMWFAALSNYEQEPWIVHLVYKLLHNDAGVLSLMANRPFPHAPPRFIRAERYRYRFTRIGQMNGAYWQRERLAAYLPPLSLDSPSLLEFLGEQGFLRSERLHVEP
jgi:hypothetical protein